MNQLKQCWMQIQTEKMAQEHACVHYIVFEARLLGAVGSEVLLQRFKGAQLKPCIDCSDTSASN